MQSAGKPPTACVRQFGYLDQALWWAAGEAFQMLQLTGRQHEIIERWAGGDKVKRLRSKKQVGIPIRRALPPQGGGYGNPTCKAVVT